MKLFYKLYERFCAIAEATLVVAFVLFWFVYILKFIVEPLAPFVTFAFVFCGTIFSMEKRITAILSIGGLALYLASWPAVALWGVAGMLVWTLGVTSWIIGVFRPFPCLQVEGV